MTRLITTFFFVGLLRPASGTWGSAAAVAVGLILHGLGHFPLLLAATVAVIPLSFWSVARELRDRPGEDPSEIVIDEVAGQWIALCFPSAGFWFAGLESWNFPWPGWVSAFVLFRLFDVWKPWIIGRADRRGDPAGVVLDDLWAGIFAGIGTIILAALSHGVLMR
ncbi:phosphatidylglycerophosphatase A [Ostreiculturibacter nitratireducens]|uniref:phosphatidylglycerophosphatase A family protein n=1 Tax=Ostreiculturibacter nitratireducens TaxID=3075226 RepID=UPI0031B65077